MRLAFDDDGDGPALLFIHGHRSLPDARLCVIPGAGHLPNLEKPEAFDRCLSEFLAALCPGDC